MVVLFGGHSEDVRGKAGAAWVVFLGVRCFVTFCCRAFAGVVFEDRHVVNFGWDGAAGVVVAIYVATVLCLCFYTVVEVWVLRLCRFCCGGVGNFLPTFW